MSFILQPWHIVLLTASRNFNDTGADDYLRGTTTFATFLVESGANVKETQSLMRHADPRITMNMYARTRDSRLAAITETVSERLGLNTKCAIGVLRKAIGGDTINQNDCSRTTYVRSKMERETGIEPATSSLGSWRSTD